MPIYSYVDIETGNSRDEHRPVDARDVPPDVPGRWTRVTVPQRVGILGAASDPQDQTAVMRRGYYDLECQGELQKKFTPQEIADAKKAWAS